MSSTAATAARHVKVRAVSFGNDLPLVLIAGPCQMESREHALEVATAFEGNCSIGRHAAGLQDLF